MNWTCIYCNKINNFSTNIVSSSSKKYIHCNYCNFTNYQNRYKNRNPEEIGKYINKYKKINKIVDSIPYSTEKEPSNYITREILIQCCSIDSTHIIPEVTEHLILEHIKHRLYVQRKVKWDNYRRALCKKKYYKLIKYKICSNLYNDIMLCILEFL